MYPLVVEAYKHLKYKDHLKVYKYNRDVNEVTVDFMRDVLDDPCCCSMLLYLNAWGYWREFQAIHPLEYPLYKKEDLWYYMPDGTMLPWKALTTEQRRKFSMLFPIEYPEVNIDELICNEWEKEKKRKLE